MSATLGFNAVLLGVLAWAYASPRFASQRMSMATSLRLPWPARARVMVVTSALSLLTVFGFVWALYGTAIHDRPVGTSTIVLQTIGVLVLYDFAYYILHRLMHVKKLMRWVHGMHHRARNPSALESFYLHPVELFAGLALLFASVLVAGPVHVYAFTAAFFVYSTLNILVHSGLVFGGLALRPIDFLAKKHHVHHADDFGRNYSSLTPLPDLLFGTAK